MQPASMLLASLALHALVLVWLASASPAELANHSRVDAAIDLPPNIPPCISLKHLPIYCHESLAIHHVKVWTVVLQAFPFTRVLDVGAKPGCLTALALGCGATV